MASVEPKGGRYNMHFLVGSWFGFFMGLLFCGFARSGSLAFRAHRDKAKEAFSEASLAGHVIAIHDDQHS